MPVPGSCGTVQTAAGSAVQGLSCWAGPGGDEKLYWGSITPYRDPLSASCLSVWLSCPCLEGVPFASPCCEYVSHAVRLAQGTGVCFCPLGFTPWDSF